MPLNLLGDERGRVNYVTTGQWSEGAISDVRKYADVTECTWNKETKYTTVAPSSDWKIDSEAQYVHYCDNETVVGIEFNNFPFEKFKGQKVVCDMSSNFCSRPVDWSKFDVVYAGAQKNVGPSGSTIVVVRTSLIKEPSKKCPVVLDWNTYSKAATKWHNTPACYAIYMAGLNIEYMLENGGLEGME